MSKKTFKSISPSLIFLILGIVILLGSGIYLALEKYKEPKLKIQPVDSIELPKVTQVVPVLQPEYLNKLIAKEWYWSETLLDSSVGIKPYNLNAFRIKFNSDLTFNSSSDCNSIGGTFEIFENKIRFKEIVRSEKYCMKSREEEYVEGLTNASEILFNEKGELILKYKDSTTFMRFK